MIIKDDYGNKHEATLINNDTEPYLEYQYTVVQKMYNPKYGDSRLCICGHQYASHFDSYEGMRPAGCKYCGCSKFREKKPDVPKGICILCGKPTGSDTLRVCDACALDIKID